MPLQGVDGEVDPHLQEVRGETAPGDGSGGHLPPQLGAPHPRGEDDNLPLPHLQPPPLLQLQACDPARGGAAHQARHPAVAPSVCALTIVQY